MIALQRRNNLEPVGHVGKLTRAIINESRASVSQGALSRNEGGASGENTTNNAGNAGGGGGGSATMPSAQDGGGANVAPPVVAAPPVPPPVSPPIAQPYPELTRKPLVGVYYFGVWSPALYDDRTVNLPIPNSIATLSWWVGVEDFFMKTGAAYNVWAQRTPNLIDFSDRKPNIGYYDLRDASVVERHIDQASKGSIDFFNFYWFWSKKNNAPGYADGLKSFRQASNKSKMRFAISIYANNNPDLNIPDEDIPQAAAAIADTVADPAYLRIGGRPVLYVSDGRGIGDGMPATVTNFITLIQKALATNGMPAPLIIGGAGIANGTAAQIVQMPIDALSCLHPRSSGVIAGDDYDAFVAGIPSYYAGMLSTYGKPVAPCAAANIDERPLQIHNLAAGPDAFRYYANFTPYKFYLGLQAVRSWQKTQTAALSDIVSVYAWNEWWEGGFLEPNVRDGDLLLNLVQRAFRTVTLNKYAGSTVAMGHRVTTQPLSAPWTLEWTWKMFNEQDTKQSRTPLYECRDTSYRYFVSTRTDCEGSAALGMLGFLAAGQYDVQGLVPLYRCSLPSGDHFVSGNADCDASSAPAFNIRTDILLGYVFPY